MTIGVKHVFLFVGIFALTVSESSGKISYIPNSVPNQHDGNLLQDGKWQYTWDAENRLIGIESNAGFPACSFKVKHQYDYIGRRTEKKVFDKDNNLASHAKFAYSGWNLVATFNADNVLQRSYTWGENGELISDTDCVNNKTYLAVYDGNRNIVSYVDRATGAKVASYEYDAFGKIIFKTGPLADDFVFRFSSCQFDKETGLIYYGYRYYNPETRRWLSRDPIEEKGGNNPYRITSNDTINKYDVLGMWGSDVHYEDTIAWARITQYSEVAAYAIATADNAVDAGGTSPMPWQDQSYHFSRPWTASKSEDSRIKHSKEHLKNAKEACSDGRFGLYSPSLNDNPDLAVVELGLSLHPLQDYYAHGDFGRYSWTDDTWVWHNHGSPQRISWLGWLTDNPANYPDNPRLDANGTDGRPAGDKVLVLTWTNFEYAEFKLGSQRISATKSETMGELKEFQQHLKVQNLKTQKKCCKCLDYFGMLK